MALDAQLYTITSTIIANLKLNLNFTMFLYWTNQHKYYKLFEQKTLFNTTDIICVWGRTGGNLGNYKVIPCKNKEEVAKTVEQIKRTRLSRGYKAIFV